MQMPNEIRKIINHRSLPLSALFLYLCLLLLAGCAAEATAEPTAEVVPTATVALAVIAEATATPLPSPTIQAEEAPQIVAAAAVTETIAPEEPTPPEAAGADEVQTEPATEIDETVRDAEGKCLAEFALDLAGYPELEGAMGCAIQGAIFDPVAINEFGPGPDHQQFMLWFGATEQIVVLLPNATWRGYLDTWSADEAEIQCNPYGGPSESPPLPRRGFGKLWCSEAEIQSLMGTIEREERLCQHAVVQRFEQGRLVACFEDATIRYFRILEDGSWSHLFVQ